MGKEKPAQITVAYAVLHHRLFEKEILKIPANYQKRIYGAITSLRENATQLPSNTAPLSGYKSVFRTRIGDYRLIYHIYHPTKTILMLGVNTRGDAYKILRRMLN